MSLYDNYTYGSFTYVPVGTICTIHNAADKSYNNHDMCVVAEPCMAKDKDGESFVVYPTNIIVDGKRKGFERNCFTIKQYPLAEEMWLNQKIADLTKPLWMFPDAVKYNL